MSAQPLLKTKYMTDAEYIEMEMAAESKHDYFNGVIFESELKCATHNRVAAALIGAVGTQLRATLYHLYGSDMRVKVEQTGMRVYPDLSIACEPEFENGKQLDLINPLVIFEILSPGTAAYDRGEKFRHYRTIPSLNESILIEQNRPHIEQYIRQEKGGWLMLEYDGLEREIKLASVPCVLKLGEVYERITFEESPPIVRQLNQSESGDE